MRVPLLLILLCIAPVISEAFWDEQSYMFEQSASNDACTYNSCATLVQKCDRALKRFATRNCVNMGYFKTERIADTEDSFCGFSGACSSMPGNHAFWSCSAYFRCSH